MFDLISDSLFQIDVTASFMFSSHNKNNWRWGIGIIQFSIKNAISISICDLLIDVITIRDIEIFQNQMELFNILLIFIYFLLFITLLIPNLPIKIMFYIFSLTVFSYFLYEIRIFDKEINFFIFYSSESNLGLELIDSILKYRKILTLFSFMIMIIEFCPK